jgi:hypothetical protein
MVALDLISCLECKLAGCSKQNALWSQVPQRAHGVGSKQFGASNHVREAVIPYYIESNIFFYFLIVLYAQAQKELFINSTASAVNLYQPPNMGSNDRTVVW